VVGPADDIVRKVLLTYWNTASFFTLYAAAAGYDPAAAVAPTPEQRPLLDRWLASEVAALVSDVDDAMSSYDTVRAGRRLSGFIDDLSNWYVRRSRRRFWDGDPAALTTLHNALDVLTRLLAPLVPFVTEQVWSALMLDAVPGVPESVHLAEWPVPGENDSELRRQMALARRLVDLGRTARTQSKVRTRQPLSRALVAAAGWEALPAELRAQVADELNVRSVEPLTQAGGELVDVTVKASFRTLGRRFGKGVQAVAAAVADADPAELAAAIREGTATVVVDGEPVRLDAADLIVTETPRAGWAVASEHGESLALDLTVTPELHRAGLAREVVRAVQEARKASGLAISDRIALWWVADDGEASTALREHKMAVAAEVLATSYTNARPPDEELPEFTVDPGVTFWLSPRG
jgi:isoleucyl-tRNA synthetase